MAITLSRQNDGWFARVHKSRSRSRPCLKVIPFFLHCASSTAHNIPTSKMAAILPTSAKRTSNGLFCKAKAFIRNNNAADRLTAPWFAIEKQENERNVRDPEVCSGFSLRGRRVVELLKYPG